MNRIYCSGLTHPGRVRRRNEDSYCICSPERCPCTFAAVADGIGGHDKGEVASELCCSTLLEQCMKPDSFLALSDPERQLKALTEILCGINNRITRLNTMQERRSPMGTTVCATIFGPDYTATAYAGDSRFYELTDSKLLQRSTDQTLGEVIRAHQRISPEKEISQDVGNIITNALGIYAELEAVTMILPRTAGHQYLLCSDGLHHVLPEQRIFTVLQEALTRKIAQERLLLEALEAGAPDNVTIVIGSEEPPKHPAQKGMILC